MPRLSIWMVRTALIYLAVGFGLGGLLLINKGVTLDPALIRLTPVHIEMMLLGWVVQLAMGVAYWILPRWITSRGDVRPAVAAYVLLNAGIVLLAAATWFALGGAALIAARVLEALAVIAYALHLWPRVKPVAPH
jgi:heme/copper-type cytochrome/quinol oxidase subunit 1